MWAFSRLAHRFDPRLSCPTISHGELKKPGELNHRHFLPYLALRGAMSSNPIFMRFCYRSHKSARHQATVEGSRSRSLPPLAGLREATLASPGSAKSRRPRRPGSEAPRKTSGERPRAAEGRGAEKERKRPKASMETSSEWRTSYGPCCSAQSHWVGGGPRSSLSLRGQSWDSHVCQSHEAKESLEAALGRSFYPL